MRTSMNSFARVFLLALSMGIVHWISVRADAASSLLDIEIQWTIPSERGSRNTLAKEFIEVRISDNG